MKIGLVVEAWRHLKIKCAEPNFFMNATPASPAWESNYVPVSSSVYYWTQLQKFDSKKLTKLVIIAHQSSFKVEQKFEQLLGWFFQFAIVEKNIVIGKFE